MNIERWLEMPDQQMFAYVNGAEAAPAEIDSACSAGCAHSIATAAERRDVGAKSPAELLRAGKPLTLAQVADGAEGLVLADLARAIAARADAPAISLAVVCRDGQRMAQLSRALVVFRPRSS